MVKSDTSILVHGKDSSNISVVSEKGTAPRVEMRKKLPIPPPFVVTSQSYTPEYPWIGQPRPPPKTWSWKSVARIALYVVLLATAFGLVMYSAHRLIRWNKKAPSPQADGLIHAPGQQEGPEELIRVDQLVGQVETQFVVAQLIPIPVPPEIPMQFQPGELLRAQMLRRQEDGALPLSVPIPVPQEEPSVPTASDLMRDQASGGTAQVIRVSVSLTKEEGPLPQQDREEPQQQETDISLSISAAPRDSQSDSDKAVNVKPADVGEGTPVVEDKALLRSAGLTGEMAEVADGPSRDASAVRPEGNLLASAGLIGEAIEARSDQSPSFGGNDEQLSRSAAKTSEMTEALTPQRLDGGNDPRDKNLLRSVGMSSEDASRPDRGNYDGDLLRSSAMTSEMTEAETLRGQRRGDLDKSPLRSAGLTSEIVEAMHINKRNKNSQKKMTPAPASETTLQKQEDAQTQTPEDVKGSPAQQSNEVVTEANAIKLSKAKRILARLSDIIQQQRALAKRLSALKKRAQEQNEELAKKDLDPQQKAMAAMEKIRIQKELAVIATIFWKQLAEIRALRKEAAEAGIRNTMQADENSSPIEEKPVTPAQQVERQTQNVQPVEVQPVEIPPEKDQGDENSNIRPLQSAGLTSEVVEAMHIRDRKNALRKSKIPHASEETAASPGRLVIGQGSNLMKPTQLTSEMAEAVYIEPSILRVKKDFSISEKEQKGVAVSPRPAIGTSSQKLQGAQTQTLEEEQANGAAAEVDPIKFATAQKLMTRLRDLKRRQRNLMKRVTALKMRAQELQQMQQMQQVHGEQEMDPQQKIAEAMKRERRLIRVQRELAGLASVFRDQLVELDAIKKESKEAGLLGTTNGESEQGTPAVEEMMQRVTPAAPVPVEVQPPNFQRKFLIIQPQGARPQVLIGQPQEVHPQMLTGQPQEIRSQVLVDQPQNSQPRALVGQPQEVHSQALFEQPQGGQPHVFIGQPQRVRSQEPSDQSQEVHSQEVVGSSEAGAPQHLQVQLPLMLHVLQQRQLQRDAWQQEQRALAFLQLMDLYRRHGRLEQQAGQQRHQHQQALQRLQQLADSKAHAQHADSMELLSNALESPITMSQSSPHTDAHHTHTPQPASRRR